MEMLTTNTRNRMAAIYGLLAGIYYIAVTTLAYKEVSNAYASLIVKVSGYLLLFVLLGFFASRIKKANGGYLEFKHTFGVIFIMIFISCALNYIYNYIYIEYLDPDYVYKMKAATLAAMEKGKSADVVKAAADMDKQIAESKKFSLGNNLMNFCMVVLYNSLPGLITALIVKKNREA